MKTFETRKITLLGLMTAMAVVLTFLFRFPLVPSVSFLTYDPKDIVLMLTGFIFGPLDALIVIVLSSLVEALMHGDTIWDIIMNIIASGTYICIAALIYKRIHTRNGAIIGLAAGLVVNVIAMVIWNYIVDPIYFGMPQEAVIPMLPAIALFNVLKCAINSAIVLIIYKPVVEALRSSGMLPKSDAVSSRKSFAAAGVFVLLVVIGSIIAASSFMA